MVDPFPVLDNGSTITTNSTISLGNPQQAQQQPPSLSPPRTQPTNHDNIQGIKQKMNEVKKPGENQIGTSVAVVDAEEEVEHLTNNIGNHSNDDGIETTTTNTHNEINSIMGGPSNHDAEIIVIPSTSRGDGSHPKAEKISTNPTLDSPPGSPVEYFDSVDNTDDLTGGDENGSGGNKYHHRLTHPVPSRHNFLLRSNSILAAASLSETAHGKTVSSVVIDNKKAVINEVKDYKRIDQSDISSSGIITCSPSSSSPSSSSSVVPPSSTSSPKKEQTNCLSTNLTQIESLSSSTASSTSTSTSPSSSSSSPSSGTEENNHHQLRHHNHHHPLLQCNSSSPTSTTIDPPEMDNRKVEPLKINLHRDPIKTIIKLPKSTSSATASASSVTTHDNSILLPEQQPTIPKITIKPIIKPQSNDDSAAMSGMTGHEPIPKLTLIVDSTANSHHHVTDAHVPQSEPHIVPKLTIRNSTNSSIAGGIQSEIVPKLTITYNHVPKDVAATVSATATTASSSIGSNAAKSESSNQTPSNSKDNCLILEDGVKLTIKPILEPPIPKLTIKASSNDCAEVISNSDAVTTTKYTINSVPLPISPAVTRSSSKSAINTPKPATNPTNQTPTTTPNVVPKIKIKQIVNAEESSVEQTVPKFTISRSDSGTPMEEKSTDLKMVPKLLVRIPKDSNENSNSKVITSSSSSSDSMDDLIQPNAIENLETVPKITIRQIKSQEKSPEENIVIPKVTIKPIVNPNNSAEDSETLITPKITIKPIPKPLDITQPLEVVTAGLSSGNSTRNDGNTSASRTENSEFVSSLSDTFGSSDSQQSPRIILKINKTVKEIPKDSSPQPLSTMGKVPVIRMDEKVPPIILTTNKMASNTVMSLSVVSSTVTSPKNIEIPLKSTEMSKNVAVSPKNIEVTSKSTEIGSKNIEVSSKNADLTSQHVELINEAQIDQNQHHTKSLIVVGPESKVIKPVQETIAAPAPKVIIPLIAEPPAKATTPPQKAALPPKVMLPSKAIPSPQVITPSKVTPPLQNTPPLQTTPSLKATHPPKIATPIKIASSLQIATPTKAPPPGPPPLVKPCSPLQSSHLVPNSIASQPNKDVNELKRPNIMSRPDIEPPKKSKLETPVVPSIVDGTSAVASTSPTPQPSTESTSSSIEYQQSEIICLDSEDEEMPSVPPPKPHITTTPPDSKLHDILCRMNQNMTKNHESSKSQLHNDIVEIVKPKQPEPISRLQIPSASHSDNAIQLPPHMEMAAAMFRYEPAQEPVQLHPLLIQNIERANLLAAMMNPVKEIQAQPKVTPSPPPSSLHINKFNQNHIQNVLPNQTNNLLSMNDGSSSDCIMIEEDNGSHPFGVDFDMKIDENGPNSKRDPETSVDRDSGVDVSNSVKSVFNIRGATAGAMAVEQTPETASPVVKRGRGRPRKDATTVVLKPQEVKLPTPRSKRKFASILRAAAAEKVKVRKESSPTTILPTATTTTTTVTQTRKATDRATNKNKIADLIVPVSLVKATSPPPTSIATTTVIPTTIAAAPTSTAITEAPVVSSIDELPQLPIPPASIVSLPSTIQIPSSSLSIITSTTSVTTEIPTVPIAGDTIKVSQPATSVPVPSPSLTTSNLSSSTITAAANNNNNTTTTTDNATIIATDNATIIATDNATIIDTDNATIIDTEPMQDQNHIVSPLPPPTETTTTPPKPEMKERKRRIRIDDDDESPTFNPLSRSAVRRGRGRGGRGSRGGGSRGSAQRKHQRPGFIGGDGSTPTPMSIGVACAGTMSGNVFQLQSPDKSNDGIIFTTPEGKQNNRKPNFRDIISTPASAALQMFEEDTRMSADSFTTPMRNAEFLHNEESQSSLLSSASTSVPVGEGSSSGTTRKRGKIEVTDPEGKTEFSVDMIAEYDWPPPKGCCPARNRDSFMIQEQVAEYLGVKSFKRKYPDLPRRMVEMEERNYLMEKGMVSEKMCDLGLTAVLASDVLDIMHNDFYEKYEEYKKFLRVKHIRELAQRQKAQQADAAEKNLSAREHAIRAASSWNQSFNKSRKEDRRQCLDLQTMIIHLPEVKTHNVNRPPPAPVSNYPVALVPGQFQEFYREYSAAELLCYPINTALADPVELDRKLREYSRTHPDSESDSSSSDDSDSSSDDSDSDSSSDSSDEEAPKFNGKCRVCDKPQNVNRDNKPEVFVMCSTCRRRAHPSCIEMPPRMSIRVQDYAWQCTECKHCTKCRQKFNEDKMLYCDQCDRGYHIYCIGLKGVPDGRWHCSICSICSLCGSRYPEGHKNPNLTTKQRQKLIASAKWTHEYRISHISNLREHSAMLCTPCARTRTITGATSSTVTTFQQAIPRSSPLLSSASVASNVTVSTVTSVTNKTIKPTANIMTSSSNSKSLTTKVTTTTSAAATTTNVTPKSTKTKTTVINSSTTRSLPSTSRT